MKIFKILTLFMGLLAGITATAQQVNTALRLLEMEQYNHAKQLFIHNLNAAQGAMDWYYLGKIYAIQQNADSARYCFAKVSELDSKNPLAMVGQAMVENMGGNQAQAQLTLEKSQRAAISYRDVNAMTEIATARYFAGDTLKWQITLELASEIDKKNPRPYIVGGNLYTMMGEKSGKSHFFGLASGRYHQALYLQPDNAEALTQLAAIDIRILNYDDAEAMLRKVFKTDSLYLPALKNTGELMYTLGRYRAASEFYGKYMQLAEYTDKDLVRYVNILFLNKQYALASGYINKVLIANPSNPVMLRLKGYTAYELNQNKEGLDAMQKFFALRAGTDAGKLLASDYEYYGKLLARSGNDSLAVVNLVKSFEMDAEKTSLLEDIAKLLEKLKRYPEAISYYEKLVEAKNDNVPSIIYFSMGKDILLIADRAKGTSDSLLRPAYLQKAVAAFGKVVDMSPSSYLGYQWRARALAALDPETTQGSARSDYEKALEMLELKNEPKKYGSDLIEAYRYLGYFHYLQYDAVKKNGDAEAREKAKNESLSYWQKVLLLDPNNDIAKQAIAALK